MRFKQIPSNPSGDKAFLCEFESGTNIENEVVAALASQLDVMLDQGIKWVIIDFSNVTFISSAGVGTLLSRRRKFRRTGGDIVLSCVPDEIIYVFKELNLVDHLNMTLNVDEALESTGIERTGQSA